MSDYLYLTRWQEIIGHLLGDGWPNSEYVVLKDTNKIKPNIYLRFDNDTISTIPILPNFNFEDLYYYRKNLKVYKKFPDTWKSCIKKLTNESCEYIRFQNKMQLRGYIYELIDEGYVYDDNCIGIDEIIKHNQKLIDLWKND